MCIFNFVKFQFELDFFQYRFNINNCMFRCILFLFFLFYIFYCFIYQYIFYDIMVIDEEIKFVFMDFLVYFKF